MPRSAACFFQHVRNLVHQLRQIKGHAFQHDLAGLQLAHVQHLVHQLQQQGGVVPDGGDFLPCVDHIAYPHFKGSDGAGNVGADVLASTASS